MDPNLAIVIGSITIVALALGLFSLARDGQHKS